MVLYILVNPLSPLRTYSRRWMSKHGFWAFLWFIYFFYKIDYIARPPIVWTIFNTCLVCACTDVRGIYINHYGDVIMDTIASQITSLAIVFSTVYLDIDQRKHQSSASLAFVWGIHRGPVNSPHKWPVTRKMFPFDDVIMLRINIAYKYTQYVVNIQFLCFPNNAALLNCLCFITTGNSENTTLPYELIYCQEFIGAFWLFKPELPTPSVPLLWTE